MSTQAHHKGTSRTGQPGPLQHGKADRSSRIRAKDQAAVCRPFVPWNSKPRGRETNVEVGVEGWLCLHVLSLTPPGLSIGEKAADQGLVRLSRSVG